MWAKIGPGDGLLPGGTKLLHELIVAYRQKCGICLRAIPFDMKGSWT